MRSDLRFDWNILKDKLLFIPLWFLRNVAFRLSCETLIIILRNFYARKPGCYNVSKGNKDMPIPEKRKKTIKTENQEGQGDGAESNHEVHDGAES